MATDPEARLWPLARTYSLCLGAVAVCFSIRYALQDLIIDQDPFMFFAPAAFFAAWHGGWRPGVFAWLAGLVLGEWFFDFPRFAFAVPGPVQITLICTYSVATLTGVGLFQLVHQKDRLLQQALRQANAYGLGLEREIAQRKQTETELRQAQDQLRDYNSRLDRLVTERTEDLRQSLHSLEGVLYHVAHDLRAPLRAMQGFSTLLLDRCGPLLDTEGQEHGRRISEAATRMDRLIFDLLEYGRISHIELPCRPLVVEPVLDKVLAGLQTELTRSQGQVQVQAPLPKVQAQASALEDALRQLLANALKFARPDVPPTVTIWAEPNGAMTRLSIQDNGLGIPPEFQEKIFQPFEKVHAAGADSGTGIGLAIVKKAVERMHGRVGLESRPGEGSRFWIELPAAGP